MANSQDTISVLYQIKDEMSAELRQINAGMRQFNDNVRNGYTESNRLDASFKKVAGAIASIGVAMKAIDFGKKAIENFKVQDKANKAVALSFGDGANEIHNFAGELQGLTNIGDETTLMYASMLKNMGLTTKQTKEILKASADLVAGSGGTLSLESAVRNLSKTYSGLAGELGESVPALRELTKEQLQAGLGVKLIAEQYKGLAGEVAKTPTGQIEAVTGRIGDLEEEIGAKLIPAQLAWLETQETLIKVVRDMSPVLTGVAKTVEFFAGGIQTLADNKVATGVGALSLAIIGLGSALKAGTISATTFSTALSANPIGVTTIAVLGLVSAMDKLTGSFEENLDKQAEFLDADAKTTQQVVDNLKRLTDLQQKKTALTKDERAEIQRLHKETETLTGENIKYDKSTREAILSTKGFFGAGKGLVTTIKTLETRVKAKNIIQEKSNKQSEESAKKLEEEKKAILAQAEAKKKQAEAEKAFIELKKQAGVIAQEIEWNNFLASKSAMDQEKLEVLKIANERKDKLVKVYGEESEEVKALQEQTRRQFKEINDKYDKIDEEARLKAEEQKLADKEKADEDRQIQLEKEREYYTQIVDFAQQGANNISAILDQVNKKRLDNLNIQSKKEIEAVKKSTLSEEEKAKKIEQIEKKLADERFKLEMADWRNNMIMSIVNTALAVSKTLASVPYPASIPLAIGAGVTGAVQTGIIASNKPQKMAEGGVVGGGSTVTDKVPALLNPDEVVVSKRGVRRVADALNNGEFGGVSPNITVSAPITIQGDADEATAQSIVDVSEKMVYQVVRAIEIAIEEDKLNRTNIVGK